jgi:hypothetical protein
LPKTRGQVDWIGGSFHMAEDSDTQKQAAIGQKLGLKRRLS